MGLQRGNRGARGRRQLDPVGAVETFLGDLVEALPDTEGQDRVGLGSRFGATGFGFGLARGRREHRRFATGCRCDRGCYDDGVADFDVADFDTSLFGIVALHVVAIARLHDLDPVSDPGLVQSLPGSRHYDAAAGGQRFILSTPVAEAGESPPAIRVVQNWYEEFRDRN